MEKISKRVSAIEEVNNNVKLLTEMVMNHSQGGSAGQSSEELMKELYQRCERMRPTLFRLASDTEDNDEALAEILQANDSLTQAINLYKQLVRGEEVNGEAAAAIPGEQRAGRLGHHQHHGRSVGSASNTRCRLSGGSGAPSWLGRLQKCSWGAGEL